MPNSTLYGSSILLINDGGFKAGFRMAYTLNVICMNLGFT